MRVPLTLNSVHYLYNDSYIHCEEYEEDFKKLIRERDRSRINFLHQSPEIHCRKELVDFLRRVCDKKCLNQCCLHLAVYLMDVFMDNHSIIPERLFLVAAICLLLAAKLEECTKNIPKIHELNEICNKEYWAVDYKNLEILVLRFFKFYVNFPTAAQYVFYFGPEILCSEDLDVHSDIRNLRCCLQDAIKKYLDVVIEDVHYMQQYQPSRLAAAIVAASRANVGLPFWTRQLENLTRFKAEDLEDPTHALIQEKPLECTICTSPSNLQTNHNP